MFSVAPSGESVNPNNLRQELLTQGKVCQTWQIVWPPFCAFSVQYLVINLHEAAPKKRPLVQS